MSPACRQRSEMNPAFAFAPLRLSLSASRGAPRHVLSLSIPPLRGWLEKGGALLRTRGARMRYFTGCRLWWDWYDQTGPENG